MSSLDKMHPDQDLSLMIARGVQSGAVAKGAGGNSSNAVHGKEVHSEEGSGDYKVRTKSKRSKLGPARLQKKVLIFQILEKDPEMHALELIDKMRLHGFELTRSSAYRALSSFRENANLADSEVRCLKLVSAILQEVDDGVHLTARQIMELAKSRGNEIHRSTIYRVLERLCSSSLVLTMRNGRQSLYEWKRDDKHHGHLTCIECGKTIEFHHDDLDEMARSVCKRSGYEFARIEFLVRSICFDCWTSREEMQNVD